MDEAAAGPGGHLGAVGDAEEVVLLEVAELCVEVAAGVTTSAWIWSRVSQTMTVSPAATSRAVDHIWFGAGDAAPEMFDVRTKKTFLIASEIGRQKSRGRSGGSNKASSSHRGSFSDCDHGFPHALRLLQSVLSPSCPSSPPLTSQQ